MIDHALNNQNEHLKITGDTSVANMYLPFARKQVNTLFNLSKQLNSPLVKRFNIDNVTISIRVFENQKFIEIHAVKLTEEEKTCGTYVSGLVRTCQKVLNPPKLNEYFPKGGQDWQNLEGYAIDPDSFLTDLGYETSSKTQHAYIKSSQYTGFMRYAIQNLLGQNKKIGYKYGFKETDGLIVENIIPKSINNNEYYIQDVLDLRLIKISDKGVFIKKAEHCKPFNIQFTPELPGVIYPNTPSEEINSETFVSLLVDTSFDIPEQLTSDITQLISEEGMSEFYLNKNGLFNSCGWLIPSHHTYQAYEEVAEGNTRTRIYGIFNTCQDETKSYLYGIKLTQKMTVLSDSFKSSQEYLTNHKYSSKPNVIYDYTATLNKLMEGQMSSPQLTYPWLSTDIGLYVPNENLDMLIKYNGITQAHTVDEYAPMYVFDDGDSYNLNHFNLCIVGLKSIEVNIKEESDTEINALEKSITNYFGNKFFSNTQLGRVKINIDPENFNCDPFEPVVKGFNSSEISDNDDETVRTVSRKISFTNFNHRNEKIIIPQYNRNAVISCYSGNYNDPIFGNAFEIEQQEFIYNYSSDSNQVTVVTPYIKTVDGYTQYQSALFEKLDGVWQNTDGFNIYDYIKPYILFYYKNMFRHYTNQNISLYSFGKYPSLNMGSDYDINYPYNLEAKDWATTYIDDYVTDGNNFGLTLTLDVFAARFVFYLKFEEGIGYTTNNYDYPDFEDFSYFNYIGRP